jgi:16S rRNA (adenine1518-N6/adenine1519-N6)-dimethyltransferase
MTMARASRAKKRFGQHFLEAAWVAKLLRAIAPERWDVFLEIGPGRGALTFPLAEAAARVVAFEIDRELAAGLQTARHDLTNKLVVAQGNFLDVPEGRLRAAFGEHPGPIRVAGNLPYNVASPILFRLTELSRQGLPLGDATVMVQREVADRLVARPGTRDYGVLTVLIGRHWRVDRVLDLPPGAFRPMPKVHSTVVRLTPRAAFPVAKDEAVFEALTQAVFTRRRKTLSNSLRAYSESERVPPATALERAGLDGSRRPETLTIQEIVRLSDEFAT